jgi:hypothetical protein
VKEGEFMVLVGPSGWLSNIGHPLTVGETITAS